MADNDPSEFEFKISNSSQTLTYGAANSTGWSYCNTCGQNACTCISSAPPAPVFAPNPSTIVFNTPNVTVDVEDIADIVNTLTVCIVCGAEDSIVLCSVCIEAVKLARNEWLDAYRREIESLI